MDIATDELPDNILAEDTDEESSDDDVDVPLPKLLKISKNVDKQLILNSTHTLASITNCESGIEGNGLRKAKISDDDEPVVKNEEPLMGDKRKAAKIMESSSDSSDDGPWSRMKKRLSVEKAKTDSRKSKTNENESSSDSSDDEPLIQIKKSFSEEKALTISRKSKTKTNNNDISGQDSSDDDMPLIKLKTSMNNNTTGDKPSPKNNGFKKAKSSDDDESVFKNEEPLSKMGVKRKAARKMESSSDSSDDEPLIEIKKRLLEEKASTNCRKSKHNDISGQDSSDDDMPLIKLKTSMNNNTTGDKTFLKSNYQLPSDESLDDAVPIIYLISKDKPVRKTVPPKKAPPTKKTPLPKKAPPTEKAQPAKAPPTKKTPLPKKAPPTKKTPAASKNKAISDNESSDDEPLINLMKKPLRDQTNNMASKTKATAPIKRTTVSLTIRLAECAPMSDLSNSSDDEPLIKFVRQKYPHVTKSVRVILSRCSAGEVGRATAYQTQSAPEIPVADEEMSPEETAQNS